MIAMLAGLITSAAVISPAQRAMLFFPLCLSIAIVYKTLRTERLKDIPLATAVLWGTIVIGMYAVAVGLWIMYRVLA